MAIVTVDTETCYAERAWTGVETSFAAGFKAEATADVEVYARDEASKAVTLLTAGVHYSASLGGDGAVTIIPIALPAAPKTILILELRRQNTQSPCRIIASSRHIGELCCA